MYTQEEIIYRKALVEVNEIISRLNEENKQKIPKKVIDAILNNMDKEYTFELDKKYLLYEQNLLPETVAIISVIYSDYLCSEEERKKWKQYDIYCMQKIEEMKTQKYNNEDIFKNENKEEKAIVKVEKKTLFKTILNKILNFIHKK